MLSYAIIFPLAMAGYIVIMGDTLSRILDQICKFLLMFCIGNSACNNL